MAPVTARQQEIIEHSIALIARKGIQELTIRNLAHDIGISDPAIYRHFASKTAILLGVLDVLEHETLGRLEPGNGAAAVGGAPETGSSAAARDALAANFRALFARLAASPELSAVIFADEFFLNEETLAQRVRALMERTQAGVERLIEQAQAAGEIRSDLRPAALATMLVGAVRLLVRRWHISGHAFDLEREGMDIVHNFLTLAAAGG